MGMSGAVLDELVRQVVAIACPLRIFLFGSAARGEWHEGSDFDLLIVVPDGVDCRAMARVLYQKITGITVPYVLVIVNVSLLERHAKTPGLIYQYALTEGSELYAA
jgi:predicted nucleotidyltransferase